MGEVWKAKDSKLAREVTKGLAVTFSDLRVRQEVRAMGKINVRRLILGCLVAGVVFNFAVIPINVWEADLFLDATEGLGISVEEISEIPGIFAFWIVLTFVLAGGGVWLYVAMRPRFGAGLKTALYAGLGAWFFFYALGFSWLAASLIFPVGLAVHVILTHVVAMCLSTVAGAWVYKEE